MNLKNKKLNNKNKVLIILILFFIYIISFYKTHANTTGSVYIESSKDIIEIDEEVEISVNIKNFKTAAFTLYLYFDEEKFQYIDGPENINIDGNRIIYVWYDEQGGNNPRSEELVRFKFKAKREGLSTFSIGGDFYTEKGQEVEINFKEKQVQIGKEESNLEKQAREEVGEDKDESNSKLENLRLDIEAIVPSFEKDIHDYYLTVKSNIKDIEVLAIAENSNAKVEITGNKNLKEGLNVIKVQVISQDKTSSSTYLINVTKTDDMEAANTNLETLAIENVLLYPAFATDITNYNAEVSNSLERVNLLAIPENEEATLEIKRDDILKEGNNEIRIIVTAANGYTKKEYLINVYKRNSEEEKNYKEGQKENQEKLNEIYETLKLSNNEQEQNQENQEKIKNSETEEKENRNRLVALFTSIAIVLIIASAAILFEKRKNKKFK